MTRITTVAVCAVIAFLASDVFADEPAPGVLIGGSAVTAGLDRDDSTIDDSGIGFKLFGQYRLNSWLGLEGSYYNSGEFESNATSAGGNRFELLYEGFRIDAVGYIPLPWEQVEFFLRAGHFFFDVESKVNGSSTGTGGDNGVVLGTGIAVQVTDHLHFRTAVDWYDADLADLASIELGLEYRF